MANRICSLCGELYTDDKGHNYDKCVEKCRQNLKYLSESLDNMQKTLNDQAKHLVEALRIQKQDWWRK